MTSSALRRAGIPIAVALVVLAVILTVVRLTDSSDGTPAGAGAGGGVGDGGVSGSPAPASSGTAGASPSVVPPEPGPEPRAGPNPDERMSRFVSVEPGSAGTTLDVRFWGGVDTCYEYTVRAVESERAVRLRLVERARSKGPCIELAQQYLITVHLKEPLGARRVADDATGETLLSPTR
jgi:hypothetical protein